MPRVSRQFAIVTLALTLASQAAWAEGGTLEGAPDHAGHPTAPAERPGRSPDSAFGRLNYASGDALTWAEHGYEPDHAGHPTKIVGIAPTRLLPTVLVVPHDSAFGWLNYSSGDATIKFDEDITPKLTCRSPGLFRASAGDLASPRVASGAFVTLCSLAPGEYDYRVELEGRQQPLIGKLVIEAQS